MKDIRKFLVILFVIFSIILATLTVMAQASSNNKISARSSVLYSPDLGLFLEENNSCERMSMASTTKIMTALIAIENLDLEKQVEVTSESTNIEGSSLYLKVGDKLTVKDLLYSLLLRSANDAAVALAIETSGNVENFAVLMNKRAEAIGLKDTNFENPHGLDSSNHFTTARDLALLASEALKNDTFKKICSTYKYSFNLGDGIRTVVNHNKLLKTYDGAIGVKTGFTKKSGRCLVSAALRDGVTLIAVTLDAANDWADHTDLLNNGFKRVRHINLSDVTNTSFTIPTIGLDKEEIRASIQGAGGIFLLDNENITVKTELAQYITGQLRKGDKVGSIKVYKDSSQYLVFDIVADEDAKQNKKDRLFS